MEKENACCQNNTPRSCDTFVVLPPGTDGDCVVFGKNSDRPEGEVQEVIYIAATDHPYPSKVKCTYIEIDQVQHTHAVILSKPAWMWGAEMGSNEHGVCIGNEALCTKLNGSEDSVKKLLGMDLLRLGLERSATAIEAVNNIVSLLEKYGQGGNCSDTILDFTYHNSFLIADGSEAWVLECAGYLWAAEKVTSGVRNISNELSIGTNIDLMSPNLKQHAEENGFWKPNQGSFNFKKAYGLDDDEYESHRYRCGRRLLTTMSSNGQFRETDMFKVLRDKPSGICMSSGSFVSTGSQVSTIRKPSLGKPSCHWFTGTPDPFQSIFKPFIFGVSVEYPPQIVSPSSRNRKHHLYKVHEEHLNSKDRKNIELMRKRKMELEGTLVGQVDKLIFDDELKKVMVDKLFKDAVEKELNLY